MSQVLKDVQITQSVVYGVFDLTDRNAGRRKHLSLHLTPEGAAAVVATRQADVEGTRAKNLIYFEIMPVLA